MSARQLAAFASTHAWQIPFDTSPRHLAGPGDARHVTHGLAAAGWTPTSDPLILQPHVGVVASALVVASAGAGLAAASEA
ncbi:hypothetical protein O3W51_47220 [Streptomyces sp. H39-C1]|nr:hypothetical protein [Streptomyces sp. H39-C1]MCZ4103661.1 hypothetical protein [Streptomyces sp. H39-C1]